MEESKKDEVVEQVKKMGQDGVEDNLDIVAQIEKTKQAAIREKIVDNVMERLQRSNANDAAGLNIAESKFSRHEQDMELLHLMNNDENEAQRQNELNQIAEIVI